MIDDLLLEGVSLDDLDVVHAVVRIAHPSLVRKPGVELQACDFTIRSHGMAPHETGKANVDVDFQY